MSQIHRFLFCMTLRILRNHLKLTWEKLLTITIAKLNTNQPIRKLLKINQTINPNKKDSGNSLTHPYEYCVRLKYD